MAGECFLVEIKRIQKAVLSQPKVFLRISKVFNGFSSKSTRKIVVVEN